VGTLTKWPRATSMRAQRRNRRRSQLLNRRLSRRQSQLWNRLQSRQRRNRLQRRW
jgi:hypothetical protein